MACADGGADRRRHGHAGGLRRRTGEIGDDSVDDSGTIFYQLEKDAQYALNSHSRNLVYQTYGAAKMARQLDAITALQFDRLNEMLVVKGLNDPAHCYLE